MIMGLLSDHLYAEVGGHIVSVHARLNVDTNLLSISGGQAIYELRVDGEVRDTHTHGTWPKGGSIFATIQTTNDKKQSIRVDIHHRFFGLFGTKYALYVDDAETTLTKSSEARIKELLHEK